MSRRGRHRLVSAGRADQPFRVHIITDGVESRFDARAVIDASGTWTQPNPAGGLTGFRPDLSFLSEIGARA